ncbi:MAG: hypothetical protein ACQEW2_12125 [Bacillota bacterium]|uniref:hypothetical protein n=2 Tax=Cytobacillus firmus TaxID=1399 RepID=UPI000B19682B|nr:hypothetical protein [Cytobacillus firmus]MEC1894288.1 hypothetical protein [Cytobacillus firmus]MED4448777.1 hypothetical protein [Cytobacillus firmus]SUV10559.1 Uncharacterised protein [Cytobacillus firmus]
MKKFSIFMLSLILLLGVYTPSIMAKEDDYDPFFCEQFKGQKKIWWDGIELVPGQIGRLLIKKDTPLFKLDGDKRTLSRTLKAGEFYRIYAFKPGLLSVGGGYYVDRDSKVTYETPSKTKLAAVACRFQVDISDLEPYEGNNTNVYTEERAKFNILDKTIAPMNRMGDGGGYTTYMLHSNYSQIRGYLVVPYRELGSDDKGGVTFYSVDKKGNETLIKEYTTEAGDDPLYFDVDLQGVNILKIYFLNYESYKSSGGGAFYDGDIYNVTLTATK